MSRIVLDTALGLCLRHSERTEDQDHTHCTRSRKAAELRQTLCFLFPPLLLCRSRLPLQPLPLLPSSFSFLPQDASFRQTAAPVCLIQGISALTSRLLLLHCLLLPHFVSALKTAAPVRRQCRPEIVQSEHAKQLFVEATRAT